ncbi:hypothetical protein MRX96_003913 [Rhipicephalus microplus]
MPECGGAATATENASLSGRLTAVTGKNRFLTARKAVSAVRVLQKGGGGGTRPSFLCAGRRPRHPAGAAASVSGGGGGTGGYGPLVAAPGRGRDARLTPTPAAGPAQGHGAPVPPSRHRWRCPKAHPPPER